MWVNAVDGQTSKGIETDGAELNLKKDERRLDPNDERWGRRRCRYFGLMSRD